MTNDKLKNARLDARLPRAVMDLIKTAAELQGRAVSEFVISSAWEAAERTIEKHSVIQLSVEDQMKFAKALLRSAKPTAGMRTAAATHAKLIDSDAKPR